MKRLVILGTGTEIGKTYVTTRLARGWRESRGPCLALKPVESGLEPAPASSTTPWDGDAGVLLRSPPAASAPAVGPRPPGWFPAELPVDSLSPASDAGALQRAASAGRRPLYGFRDPVSPHLAARRVSCALRVDQIAHWVQESIEFFGASFPTSDGRSLCLIETAGGAFSPLSPEATNGDLPQALGAESLLVAPNRLGVLHDVSSTLLALATREVSVALVVLVNGGADDASIDSNARELETVVFPSLGAARPRTGEVVHIDFRQERVTELTARVERLLFESRQSGQN